MKNSSKVWVGCLMMLSLAIGVAIGHIGWQDDTAKFVLVTWMMATFMGIIWWTAD